ncbi:MAG: phosphoribosylanthranilate isomerase, partial [Proteobacteria bacterium]|nr:phosphoribosylanthranilate isomerase [Pseudomonadota bacterium]
MAIDPARPAFVTFTGVDDAALVKGMVELSQRYPIEWGVLIDREQAGRPLFPSAQQIDRFRSAGVRLCAHICGIYAREIAGGLNPDLNLAGFSRIQVNHGRAGADEDVVNAVSRYAAQQGVRGV